MLVLNCGSCHYKGLAEVLEYFKRYRCVRCGVVNDVADVSLKSWLGFNYAEYLNNIIAFVMGDSFEALAAVGKLEVLAGKLSAGQIRALKDVLANSFAKGKSIRDIASAIETFVRPKDLFAVQNGEVVLDENGNPILRVSAEARPEMIARSETTRAAANGALETYKENGIEKVRWVAALSQRTCPECEALNGQVFNIGDAKIPPQHVDCRCTIVAVVE